MPVHDDAQERLIEAAGRIFAEKGFDGATVRDICQQANANLAAINYYFRDKERLYIETVKSACQRQAEQFPLPHWPEGTPSVTKLRDFIKTLVRRMVDHPADRSEWHRQLFLREMAQPTAACAELVRESIRPTAMILGAIVQELLPDAPESKRMMVAFSIVGQCLLYRTLEPVVSQLVGETEFRSYSAEKLAEHIADFSLAALERNDGKHHEV